MPEQKTLAEQLARRVRRDFLADPDVWGEFATRQELRAYLMGELNGDEAQVLLIRWARKQLDKTKFLEAVDVDELWGKVLKLQREIGLRD